MSNKIRLIYVFVTCLSLFTTTSCSSSSDSASTGYTSKPETAKNWEQTIPSGFTTRVSRTDDRVVSPGFAYNVFSAESYDCPSGMKRCAQASVMSEKGCPAGIFALITLKDEYGNELPGTILSEPYTKPVKPDERVVLNFDVNSTVSNALKMFEYVQMYNIACND
jgi:hypothetical protein